MFEHPIFSSVPDKRVTDDKSETIETRNKVIEFNYSLYKTSILLPFLDQLTMTLAISLLCVSLIISVLFLYSTLSRCFSFYRKLDYSLFIFFFFH